MGRPKKLTPEVTEYLVEKLARGVYLSVAAEKCGVTRQTVYKWLARGRRRGPQYQIYRDFRAAIRQATATGRLWLEERCLDPSITPKEALTILALRWPDDWGPGRGKLAKAVEELTRQVEDLKKETGSDGEGECSGESGA